MLGNVRFIGVNGTSTDLERSVLCQVLAGGQPMWPVSRVERSPPTFSMDSGFACSGRHMATKAQAEPPPTLAAGRSLGSLGLGSSPLGPCVKYTPMVMSILTFDQLHFVIP
jgi:hypothetical protein